MDEQRVQAYLSLIQELFDCPSGEEPDILNQSIELVDEGFVQVCELLATQLQEAGQENNAGFLRNVAQKVTAFLKNKESQTPLYGETYSDGFPKTPQEAVRLSEGLSEIEKQEWYEWIETATPEQQAELVDILHSMWLQHQAQAQEVETFLRREGAEGNQQRDEQRVQAYLSLIQELLACPSGEETQILNRHLELLDEGFVQVCEWAAAQLQEAGQENQAGFLRNVAQQVGAFLRRGKTRENQQQTEMRENYFQLVNEILQATLKSGGEPKAVYPLLINNLELVDLNFLKVLQEWAVQGLKQINEYEKFEYLCALGNFANIILEFPLGNVEYNIEIGIAALLDRPFTDRCLGDQTP